MSEFLRRHEVSDDPCNIESENALLGGVLIAGTTGGIDLTPDDFYIHRNGWVWEAMCRLERDGKPLDVITVSEAMGDRLREAGGGGYLATLMSSVPSSMHNDNYAKIVKDNSTRRKLLEYAANVAVMAHSPKELDFGVLEAHLGGIAGQSVLVDDVPDIVDVHLAFVGMMGQPGLCVPTGIQKIDKEFGGLEKGTQTILAARPGLGKTALVTQVAQNAALLGHTVLIFSLEMAAWRLWMRRICGAAGVSWSHIISHPDDPAPREAVEKTGMDLATRIGEKLRIYDLPSSLSTIERIVAKVNPDLIITDHLRFVTDRNSDEIQRLGHISWGIAQLAKRKGHEAAALTVSQLSRESAKQKRPPRLDDLRESGQLEENADNVLMLHSTIDLETNPPDVVPTDLLTPKYRCGQSDVTFNLWFDRPKQWFSEHNPVAKAFQAEPPPDWRDI